MPKQYISHPSDHIVVPDSILFDAFRYCLGRRTYVVGECVDQLLKHWDRIRPKLQNRIVEEIAEAIRTDQAGMDMDRRQWMRVLERAGVE